MQTISTKYLGPTNYKGARVKAFTNSGHPITVTINWNYEVDTAANHTHAALALMDKLHWKGTMEGGDTKEGMVFVFLGGGCQIERQ